MDIDKRLTALIDWVRDTAAPAGGLLVPLSGGSDSALIFWLLNQALADSKTKVVGVHIGNNLRCREWFESIGTVRLVNMPTLDADDNAEVTRWAKVQSLCVKERRWLVGSRNRTEEALGTYSFASSVATYLPLANILKSDVMELCALAGVPEEILASSRRADPDCGRPEAMAEIALEDIDVYLRVKLGESETSALAACAGLNAARLAYLDSVYERNKFKRLLPKKGPVL
jgi:NH3-dependent NAD+ synthetase